MVRKAVITAAGKQQRSLPVQTLLDQEGKERSVLSLVVREVLAAGVSDIYIVVWPGDEDAYAKVLGDDGAQVTFIAQQEARGYAHAVYSAREFVGEEPFLHCVGDHIYIGGDGGGSARHLVTTAKLEECSVSAVQVTRENLLPFYGTVGARLVPGKPGLYRVDAVIEKPTPTQAEERLIVPGLRSGQYLCFYGMHVLTPTIFGILGEMLAESQGGRVSLSAALDHLAQREKYLAMIQTGRRFDVGVRYGLLTAQLALALSGKDREYVLSELVNLLAAGHVGSHEGTRA